MPGKDRVKCASCGGQFVADRCFQVQDLKTLKEQHYCGFPCFVNKNLTSNLPKPRGEDMYKGEVK